MLVLSRKIDEKIVFPDLGITIHLIDSGRTGSRLGIQAPKEIKVLRAEIPVKEPKLNRHEAFRALQRFFELHLGDIDCNLGEMQNCLDDQDQAGFLLALNNLNVNLLKLNSRIESTKKRNNDSTPSEKRVLLIDDNTNETKLLGSYLKLKGVDVLTASDGRQAMEILDRRWDPDVVLLDMNMPVYDGQWTIEQIRGNRHFEDLVVFAVSGSSEDESAVKVGPEGFDIWFQKPLNPEQLVMAISSSL